MGYLARSASSYFYLAPGVTVLMTWVGFGETLSPIGLLGLAISVLGVYLVVRKPA